jgi:hypothetical protein
VFTYDHPPIAGFSWLGNPSIPAGMTNSCKFKFFLLTEGSVRLDEVKTPIACSVVRAG